MNLLKLYTGDCLCENLRIFSGQGSEVDQNTKLFAKSVKFYPNLAMFEPRELCVFLPDFTALKHERSTLKL